MEKRINLSFLHLHSPLFFANKNWSEKIDTRNSIKGKIEMTYDRELGEVLIKCENHISIIPISNVVSMVPITAEPNPSPISTKAPNTKIRAQASSPHDHVFAGPGAGQTGSLK